MLSYDVLKIVFGLLASGCAVFTILAGLRRGKWALVGLDLVIYFVQFPLWLLVGATILALAPGLVYSFFPGIWFVSGLLLWLAPHGVMAAMAVARGDRPETFRAIGGIGAIVFGMALLFVWDLAAHAA